MMTETHSNELTIDLSNLLLANEQNGLAGMLQTLINQLMVVERQLHMGALDGQHQADRSAYANGFKQRQLDTGVGTLNLNVPQTRAVPGQQYEPYYPSILERGIRSERALMLAIAEMYWQGVSTRDVQKIAEQLGIGNISSSKVSQCAAALDEELKKWREAPLGEFPVLMMDARYEKVRLDGCVRDCAVLTAIGIDPQGMRRVLGTSVSLSEAEIHWREFLESLVKRGLHGTKLIVSDAHKGMAAARKKVLGHARWQRCQFHLAQNAQHQCSSQKQRLEVAEDIREIFQATDHAQATELLKAFVEKWLPRNKKLAEWAEENIPEGLTILTMNLPIDTLRYLRTSNAIERSVQQELKRRTYKVRTFPNEDSLLRLVSAKLSELDEQWQSASKRYYLKAVLAVIQHAEAKMAG